MLAEILANPVALPLWAVLVFAASMYPLGLMLPGCVCCGAGNCTQCGDFSIGYAAGQNHHGAMCCSGPMSSSATLRLTSTGPATSSLVTRSSTTGSYTKTTASFACSSINGDYVLSLNRTNFGSSATCTWTAENFTSCAAYMDAQIAPQTYDPNIGSSTTVSFPSYYLAVMLFQRTISGSVRTQTCSGFPGIESCSIGSTASSSVWFYYLDPRPVTLLSDQRCNPAGTVIATDAPVATNGICSMGTSYPQYDTGCRVRVEFV